MKKSILEKYNRSINPAYYGTITISGNTTKDNKQPLSIMEQIRLEEANKPPVRIDENVYVNPEQIENLIYNI